MYLATVGNELSFIFFCYKTKRKRKKNKAKQKKPHVQLESNESIDKKLKKTTCVSSTLNSNIIQVNRIKKSK